VKSSRVEGPLGESGSLPAAALWWTRQLLAVRPATTRDAVALWSAVARATFVWGRERAVTGSFGQFLTRRIEVRPLGLRIEVQPHSDDLFYAMVGHKSALVRWFHPEAGEFVIDVGAHLGLYSLIASRSGARVLALEPNPETYASLQRQIQLNSASVEPLEVAAGREAGTAPLYASTGSSGVSSLRPEWSSQYRVASEPPRQVQVVTLDALGNERGWEAIDWLLIDAEGSEADILEGATRTLSQTRRVILEVAHGAIAERCARMLEAQGFQIVERSRQNDVNSYWLAVR
jgi:FkbM family methyltransferase